MRDSNDSSESPEAEAFSTGIVDDEPATVAVVRAIAAIEGDEVADIPQIYKSVETNALNTLAESSDVTVEFSVQDLDVIVEDEEITIYT